MAKTRLYRRVHLRAIEAERASVIRRKKKARDKAKKKSKTFKNVATGTVSYTVNL